MRSTFKAKYIRIVIAAAVGIAATLGVAAPAAAEPVTTQAAGTLECGSDGEMLVIPVSFSATLEGSTVEVGESLEISGGSFSLLLPSGFEALFPSLDDVAAVLDLPDRALLSIDGGEPTGVPLDPFSAVVGAEGVVVSSAFDATAGPFAAPGTSIVELAVPAASLSLTIPGTPSGDPDAPPLLPEVIPCEFSGVELSWEVTVTEPPVTPSNAITCHLVFDGTSVTYTFPLSLSATLAGSTVETGGSLPISDGSLTIEGLQDSEFIEWIEPEYGELGIDLFNQLGIDEATLTVDGIASSVPLDPFAVSEPGVLSTAFEATAGPFTTPGTSNVVLSVPEAQFEGSYLIYGLTPVNVSCATSGAELSWQVEVIEPGVVGSPTPPVVEPPVTEVPATVTPVKTSEPVKRLAATGSDPLPFGIVVIALAAMGMGLTLLARRRVTHRMEATR